MVIKKYIFLLLAAACSIEAMDQRPSWRQTVESINKTYLESLEKAKDPTLDQRRKNLLDKNNQTLHEHVQKSMFLLASTSLPVAILNHNTDEVSEIITDVPTVLWEKPAYHSSWIESALYDANQAARRSDHATASTLDGIAILIFNQMKQLAANTADYPASLAQILQNRNPILVCCAYNRPQVMNTFLQDIDTRWRGTQDEKSAIEWAIHEVNANTSWITAQTIHRLPTSNSPYLQSIQYAQQIIATFQQKNPSVVLQFTQPRNPQYQNHYQQPPLAQLQQQLAQQRALLEAQRLRQQPHIPGPELAPQPTALWKKIVVFAGATYALKKLYDWYYQEPKPNTDDEPDDAFYQDEPLNN